MLSVQGNCGECRATPVLDELATVRLQRCTIPHTDEVRTANPKQDAGCAQVRFGGVWRRYGSEQRRLRSGIGYLHAGVDWDIHHAA